MGHAWRDADKDAATGKAAGFSSPLRRLPDEITLAVEWIEPLQVAGVGVVAPHLTGLDGYQMKVLDEEFGSAHPIFEGIKTESPRIFYDFSSQVDEFHGCHAFSASWE